MEKNMPWAKIIPLQAKNNKSFTNQTESRFIVHWIHLMELSGLRHFSWYMPTYHLKNTEIASKTHSAVIFSLNVLFFSFLLFTT